MTGERKCRYTENFRKILRLTNLSVTLPNHSRILYNDKHHFCEWITTILFAFNENTHDAIDSSYYDLTT